LQKKIEDIETND